MLGIRSKPTPRKHRIAWAIAMALLAPVMLALRGNRFGDEPLHWSSFLIASILCSVIGYYGCTWVRDK